MVAVDENIVRRLRRAIARADMVSRAAQAPFSRNNNTSAPSAVKNRRGLCARGGENQVYSAGVIQPNSRLYFIQNANWNTTAVVGYDASTGTWQVVQRYVYSPYGSIIILNPDFTTAPAGTVPMVNNLYQGMPLDPATGLYYERARWYSPSLGIWASQDPAGYINGTDTYQFVTSNPVGLVDPTGESRINVAFDAFIPSSLGHLLPGLAGWWGKEPPRSGNFYFRTDNRGFGQFNFSMASGNARVYSIGWGNSADVGHIVGRVGSAWGGSSYTGFSDEAYKNPHWVFWAAPFVAEAPRRAPIHGPMPTPVDKSPCESTLTFSPSASFPYYPLGFIPTPSLRYDVTFDFKKVGAQVKVTLTGQHDPFPFYEEYINGKVGPYEYWSRHHGPGIYDLGPFGWLARVTIPAGEARNV